MDITVLRKQERRGKLLDADQEGTCISQAESERRNDVEVVDRFLAIGEVSN